MSSPRVPRRCLCLLAVLGGLVAAGCGSISILPGHHTTTTPVGQDGPAADPAQFAVVRGWATALRAGHITKAAGYFALPSLFANGPTDDVEVRTHAQALVVNETLPCGAVPLSAFREGRFINVLFRLSSRAGRGGVPSDCGSSARVEFLIRDGHIVEWLRAPSRPGDPGEPTTPNGGGGGGGGGGGSGSGGSII